LPRFPFARRIDDRTRALLDESRREAEALRGKLVASQNEKATALAQAAELRNEKQRLRQSLNGLKQELADQKRIDEQLKTRLSQLQEENRGLVEANKRLLVNSRIEP
jgi:hypothetical protein